MTASSTEGGQTVTVAENVGEGLQRRYIITDSTDRPLVNTNQNAVTTAGWVNFPSDGKVVGTEGQIITVVDCTTLGSYMRAVGAATLPAPNASQPDQG